MKLSKIASFFLAGGIAIGMITGCGNDSNSNRNNVGIHASDAYVIAFDQNGAPSTLVPVNCNGTNTNVAARIAGAKGYITLPSNARGCIVTLNTAYVDTDLNGEFNASVDKIMPMPLKTKVNQGKFANPITTYAIDKGDNALLNEALDFDPVQGYVEAVNGDTKAKNLVLVTEIIKTVAKVAGASSLTELNITSSDINNTNTIDPNVILNNSNINDNTIRTAVTTKVHAVSFIISNADELNLTSPEAVQQVAVLVSDADTPLNQALQAADVNISALDTNLSNLIQNIDRNISDFKNSLPAKIVVPNYIKLGNENIPVVNGSFNYVLHVNDETNITDFYDVEVPVLAITQKEVNETSPVKVRGIVTITDDNNKTVQFAIDEVDVYQDANGSTEVKIPRGTRIGLSTNINSLQEAIDGSQVDTYTSSDLVNSDFKFNVNTLINNVTANKDKIDSALEKFNDYIKRSNDYNVSIKLQNISDDNIKWIMDLPKDGNTTYELNGEVQVVNSNITLPPVHGEVNITLPPVPVPVEGNESNEINETNNTFPVEGNESNEINETNNTLNIPSTYTGEFEFNTTSLNTSQQQDGITFTKLNSSADTLEVYYKPYQFGENEVGRQVSGTFVIKKAGTEIAAVLPVGQYDGETFYFKLDDQIQSKEYNASAPADQPIVIDFQ